MELALDARYARKELRAALAVAQAARPPSPTTRISFTSATPIHYEGESPRQVGRILTGPVRRDPLAAREDIGGSWERVCKSLRARGPHIGDGRYSDGTISTAGCQEAPVGAEGHRQNRILVPCQSLAVPGLTGQVPEPNGTIITTRGEGASVTTERGGKDDGVVHP